MKWVINRDTRMERDFISMNTKKIKRSKWIKRINNSIVMLMSFMFLDFCLYIVCVYVNAIMTYLCII